MEIKFAGTEHRDFYNHYIQKCRFQDAYHKSLVYCLGISADARRHVDRIYDFESGLVKTECLHDGWQTSGSLKAVRLAFNLYCNERRAFMIMGMQRNSWGSASVTQWKICFAVSMQGTFGKLLKSDMRNMRRVKSALVENFLLVPIVIDGNK